jgi:CHAD domain-containing protein
MAFRIKPDESVAKGLRRVARRELEDAYKQTRKGSPSDAAAVHEARKSVKKARAVLDVMDNDGARGVSSGQKRLRRVNRTLSDLRDAAAMIDIFDKLTRKRPPVLPGAVQARVKRHLEAHKDQVAREVEADSWRDVGRQLRQVVGRARRWQPSHAQFGALAPGLQESHRRGRKAVQRAMRSQDADDFHEWRKQIKALRYVLRLIEDRGTAIRRDAEALDRAQAVLGDEHNVVILCQYLSEVTSLWRNPDDLDRLTKAAQRHQRTLRRRALRSASRIYRPGSKTYVRRVRDIWKGRRAA